MEEQILEEQKPPEPVLKVQPSQGRSTPLPEAWRRFLEAVQKQYRTDQEKSTP